MIAGAALSGALAAVINEKPPAKRSDDSANPASAKSSVERVAKTPKASVLASVGLKPLGDWAVDPAETQELNDTFAQAKNASASIQPGADAPAQRRAIEIELNGELESFLARHPNSAYGPSVRLLLARVYQLRCAYSAAMDHYRQVWQTVKGAPDSTAQGMARQAAGGLAKLLALTGRLDELDALTAEVRQLYGKGSLGSEFNWAMEMRAWARKHPTEAYKCGLYCLDQLGRLTQYGQFRPKDITETESSTNGFTAADLVNIGTRAGLRLRAAMLTDTNNLPVPCIVHLQSEHFVMLSEQRGAFYKVYDTIVPGPRWLRAAEVMREASGCVLVDDAATTGSFSLKPLDLASAAAFRGRCHGPLPSDHDDPPCIPDGTTCCGAGGGAGGGGGGGQPHASGAPSSCSSCTGMPNVFVTEAYLNLWVTDTPLQYTPAYGPAVWLVLAYNDRRVGNVVSGAYWHGAEFGNSIYSGFGWNYGWSCSLLSFADLDSSENTVDLALPQGNWATFNFPPGSSVSSVNYYHNAWLEKVGSPGAITALILHYPDGSQSTYGVRDDINDPYYRTYYLTARSDPIGNSTTFAYDTSHTYSSGYLLTTVTAADGATFTLHYDPSYTDFVTSISTSYGASVSFTYGEIDPDGNTYAVGALTGITDAAGIKSQVFYESYDGGYVRELITPYGKTAFTTYNVDDQTGYPLTMFDRLVRITRPDATQEFYALLNDYTLYGTDWPDFAPSQIPANTPVNTLDTTERQARNTFYWNAQQFAPFVNLDGFSFNWSVFKQGRIRHWLATTDPDTGYSHWGSISIEQAPSPDGSAEGQLTWYDYAGKPAGVNQENGTQVLPAVIAQVVPDTSTWYQYFQRTSIGKATNVVEKWVSGGSTFYRTNSYGYAANGIDLVTTTNALGIRVSSNYFNGYHQVLTNYNALNEATVYTYDSNHRLSSVQTPAGLLTTQTYGSSGRLSRSVDSISGTPLRTNSYTWLNDDLRTQTDPRGLTDTYTFDVLTIPTPRTSRTFTRFLRPTRTAPAA